MTAGDSKAALTITPQPALAPSPQPRPAPTARALPPGLVAQVGQNWTPIVGQNWMPIDTVVAFLEFHEVGDPNDAGSNFVNTGNACHEGVRDIIEIVRFDQLHVNSSGKTIPPRRPPIARTGQKAGVKIADGLILPHRPGFRGPSGTDPCYR